MELKRQMGFGSYGTAWAWLHKIRKAMVRPGSQAAARSGSRPTRPRSAAPGPASRAAVPPARPWSPGRSRAARGKASGRRLGRLRLARLPDASATSLRRLPRRQRRQARRRRHRRLVAAIAGLPAAGYDHEPVNLSASWGDAALRLPAIHLVFSLAKRWLLGTHHGAVSAKHLPAYLDEYVFRFNRRTAKSISHRFARLIEQAVAHRAHHLPRHQPRQPSLTVTDR